MNVPVWMYWEGDCPQWIEACVETVFAHAPDVRLLTWADFDRLWDVDRDIDLTSLSAVHRSDFIRAFLLAKYGGLWIDADCIVLNSLQPVLDLLTDYNFLSYFEWQGDIANNFLGARYKSQIANAYYQRVCTIARSGQRLKWLSLGSYALQDALAEVDKPWLCLDRKLIQPVHWNEPSAFFANRDSLAHGARFNERAICYMLANTMFKKYQKEHPAADLMAEDTFFSYLLQKAGEERKPLNRTHLIAPMDPQALGQQPAALEVGKNDAPSAKQKVDEVRDLPPLSCICLTYGRPQVLEEAIYSFLQQDYAGPKELIVLNDYAEQTLHFEHPEVRVINLPVRFQTVGEKMNAAVALARHDLLFVWDDDDIYLSHRLSFSVQRFDPAKGFFKPKHAWVLDNGQIYKPANPSLFHVGSCWSRRVFDAVQGYPVEGTGYDWLFEKRLARHFPGSTADVDITLQEIYYLYRWGGTGSYHMSGFGALRQGENVGHQEVTTFVQERADRGEIPLGDISLQPAWKTDYQQLVSSYITAHAEELMSVS